MSRRNKSVIIEDMFADLSLEDQNRLLPILTGLNRQKQRNGAALADKDPVKPKKEPVQPAAAETAQEGLPLADRLPAQCPHGAAGSYCCPKCVTEALSQ